MDDRNKDIASSLTLDEQDAILEIFDMPGYKVLVSKLLPALLRNKQTRILHHPILKSDDFTALALLRAEFDGAKNLIKDISELKKAYKAQAN